MIRNYIKLALRHLAKHRLYAFINIAGLALGLTVFLFGSILVSYEKNHDHMFSRRARIFTVGSLFTRSSGESVREYPVVRTAYGPLFQREIKETQQVTRAIHRQALLSVGTQGRYTSIRFADPGFTRIFDFKYIHGNRSALDNPRGLIVTASLAQKLFGRVNVLGEAVSLEHKQEMFIAAVIKDLASDSYFNASILPDFELAAIAPLVSLSKIENFNLEGDWNTFSPADMTYILLPENRDRAWLEKQVNLVADRHASPKERKFIRALNIRPLIESNTMLWDAIGFPVLETVQLLGLLVLLVACVNYTNLATAQSFGRTREVGLRKTFGASPRQLLVQFLVESLTLALLAMLIALAAIELLLPAYTFWTGKAVRLDYKQILAWLLYTTITVGLLAGIYPAYIISRLSPIDGLRNSFLKGPKGGVFRSLMIAAQFSISIFILAMVLIIFFQNKKVVELSNTYAKSRIVVLKGMAVPAIRAKQAILRRELSKLPEVRGVSFSSEVPFSETNRLPESRLVTPHIGDSRSAIKLELVAVDADFMQTYEIDLLAGRPPGPGQNLVLNQLAARQLGFGPSPGDNVIGKSFYNVPGRKTAQYRIAGVMPDQYFLGPQAKMRPMAFYVKPESIRYASIRISGTNVERTVRDIDETWKRVVVNYPIRRFWLEDFFNLFYRIPRMINILIAAFAGVALCLALVGLFGLAAFMSQARTREIGIRKVMGAGVFQIMGLLIWQISRPVLWSMVLAIPLAYLASSIYLDFFPEPITYRFPLILLACATTIISAWAIVAGHAVKTARAKPIDVLRYE